MEDDADVEDVEEDEEDDEEDVEAFVEDLKKAVRTNAKPTGKFFVFIDCFSNIKHQHKWHFY